MAFQYDATKAALNLKKHGVAFSDAEGIFYDIHRPDPDATDEARFVAVGLGSAAEILVVVYTICGENVRLISARRATRKEIRDYES